MFDEMAEEEVDHRGMLFDLYRKKFGEYLPLIRRQDVKGFVRQHAALAGAAARPRRGAQVRRRHGIRDRALLPQRRRAAHDASVRELLTRLAEAEDKHENLAHELGERILTEARAPARTRPRGACSCCNTCSRASPG